MDHENEKFQAFISGIKKEVEEMDSQEGKHCERCHTVMVSYDGRWSTDYPMVKYDDPALCPVCKSVNYNRKDKIKEAYLPTQEEGVLCQCQHPKCAKEFYNRPTWYQQQQEMAKAQNNPWMPILIDTDKERLAKLLSNNAPKEKVLTPTK